MLVSLLLGVATATATPQPVLPMLKTITHVRATPFCSTLRTHIGPAIENLLAADASIAQSPPLVQTISRDGVIFRDYPRTVLDMNRLESLVTPLVKSTQAAQKELDAATDPGMAQMRAQLEDVLKKQKDALNTISGLVGTFQAGEVMSSMSGPPAQWMAVIKNPSPSGPHVANNPFPDYGAIALLSMSFGYTHSLPPELNAHNVGLGYDPYKNFKEQLELQQSDITAKESTASQLVLDAAKSCNVDR